MDNILILASSGAMVAKILVDIIKMAFPNAPRYLLPLLALVFGVLCVLLVVFSADDLLVTRAVIARGVLAGFMAGGMAIGATELHRAAREDYHVGMDEGT